MSLEIIDDGFQEKRLRENAQRAKSVITVLYVYGALQLVALLPGVAEYIALSESENISEFSQRYAENSNAELWNAIDLLTSPLSMIASILLIVFWIMWMRRAYYNIEQVAQSTLPYTNAACAWSWFVPILNLFLPYLLMRRIWKETQDNLNINERLKESDAVITLWWVVYIGGSILVSSIVAYSIYITYVGIDMESPIWIYEDVYYNRLKTLSILGIISSVIQGLFGCIAAGMVVNKVSGLEKMLWEQDRERLTSQTV
ncbi:DUF4328 domain-containing protein [Sanyastnella coralliicola]|uniref:DUF4328 domain-containing protein n=1 Tax=Sanyastnella coralliicola TaxID=3069118 RepID=UPI0027B8CF73|nr:DUF4328 domain-containing protein [Longitalea sp. SCSIO 12813]